MIRSMVFLWLSRLRFGYLELSFWFGFLVCFGFLDWFGFLDQLGWIDKFPVQLSHRLFGSLDFKEGSGSFYFERFFVTPPFVNLLTRFSQLLYSSFLYLLWDFFPVRVFFEQGVQVYEIFLCLYPSSWLNLSLRLYVDVGFVGIVLTHG